MHWNSTPRSRPSPCVCEEFLEDRQIAEAIAIFVQKSFVETPTNGNR